MAYIEISNAFQRNPVNSAVRENYQLHGVMVEKRSHTARITQYPIESGFYISDGMMVEPETISISGLITSVVCGTLDYSLTNSGDMGKREINIINSIRALNGDTSAGSVDRDRARAAYELFRGLQAKRVVVGYVSSFASHTSLLIESFSITRDQPSLHDVKFEMVLKKISVAETDRVKAKKIIPRPKVNLCQEVKKTGEQAATQVGSNANTVEPVLKEKVPGVEAFVKPGIFQSRDPYDNSYGRPGEITENGIVTDATNGQTRSIVLPLGEESTKNIMSRLSQKTKENLGPLNDKAKEIEQQLRDGIAANHARGATSKQVIDQAKSNLAVQPEMTKIEKDIVKAKELLP